MTPAPDQPAPSASPEALALMIAALMTDDELTAWTNTLFATRERIETEH